MTEPGGPPGSMLPAYPREWWRVFRHFRASRAPGHQISRIVTTWSSRQAVLSTTRAHLSCNSRCADPACDGPCCVGVLLPNPHVYVVLNAREWRSLDWIHGHRCMEVVHAMHRCTIYISVTTSRNIDDDNIFSLVVRAPSQEVGLRPTPYPRPNFTIAQSHGFTIPAEPNARVYSVASGLSVASCSSPPPLPFWHM